MQVVGKFEKISPEQWYKDCEGLDENVYDNIPMP